MPDFDAKEDPLRLSAAGREDKVEQPSELPKLYPRFVPRMRSFASRSCHGRPARPARRVRPELVSRRRNAARRVCGERVMLLASPPRRRRRLWTRCHGRLPGSPS
ncbi:MAG TPA: hypothetical protein VF706_04485 [Solirubrobacteraceae bacterium]